MDDIRANLKNTRDDLAATEADGCNHQSDDKCTTVAPALSRPLRSETISAIIVNYGPAENTIAAVTSLRNSTHPVSEIIVVENGSGRAIADALKRRCPEASVIPLPYNRGFAAGCNVGIRSARHGNSAYLLLVNSDVVLDPSCIGTLHAALQTQTTAAVAGPTLVQADDKTYIESTGAAVCRLTGRVRQLDHGSRLAKLTRRGDARVDALSACVMLMPRQLFDVIDLFDERYFLYYEDIDLCLRARAVAVEILSVRDAVAFHKGGASIGRDSPDRLYYATRSHLAFAANRLGSHRFHRLLLTPLVTTLNIAFALRQREVPPIAALRAVFAALIDYLRGVQGPRRSSTGAGAM